MINFSYTRTSIRLQLEVHGLELGLGSWRRGLGPCILDYITACDRPLGVEFDIPVSDCNLDRKGTRRLNS